MLIKLVQHSNQGLTVPYRQLSQQLQELHHQ
ncbi:hypothetical protein GZH44_05440 [Weissella hellenica]|nr:hypothetical protein GZH44_05440 [Weissella hellenica]